MHLTAALAPSGRQPLRAMALAVLLGLLAGFVHGWNLSLVALLLLVVFFNVRARLFLAIWAVGVVLSWLLLPISYSLGRFALEATPLGEMLGLLSENPVTPLFGLGHYTITGGALLALLIFAPVYLFMRQRDRAYDARRQAPARESLAANGHLYDYENSTPTRWWRKQADEPQAKAHEPLVRPLGAPAVAVAVTALCAAFWQVAPEEAGQRILTRMSAANGASVTAAKIEVDLWGGRLAMQDVAIADPANLAVDRLRIGTLTADVDVAALAAGRLNLDHVQCCDLVPGGKRERMAQLVGQRCAATTRMAITSPFQPDDAHGHRGTALETLVAQPENVHNCLAALSRLIETLEDCTGAEATPCGRVKLTEMAAARSALGQPGPLFCVRSVTASGLACEPLAHDLVVRVMNVSRGVAPEAPTTIEIESAKSALAMRVVMGCGEHARQHAIELLAQDVALSAICAKRSLICENGLATIHAKGRLDHGRLEMQLAAQAKDLSIVLPGDEKLCGIPAATWRAALPKLTTLRTQCDVTGSLEQPTVMIEEDELVALARDQLRTAGETQLADALEQRVELAETKVVDLAAPAGQPDNALTAHAPPMPVETGAMTSAAPPNASAPVFSATPGTMVPMATSVDTDGLATAQPPLTQPMTGQPMLGGEPTPMPGYAATNESLPQTAPQADLFQNSVTGAGGAPADMQPTGIPMNAAMGELPGLAESANPMPTSVAEMTPSPLGAAPQSSAPMNSMPTTNTMPTNTMPTNLASSSAAPATDTSAELAPYAAATETTPQSTEPMYAGTPTTPASGAAASAAPPADTNVSFNFGAPASQPSDVCAIPPTQMAPKQPLAENRWTSQPAYPTVNQDAADQAARTKIDTYDDDLARRYEETPSSAYPSLATDPVEGQPSKFSAWSKKMFAKAAGAWPFKRKPPTPDEQQYLPPDPYGTPSDVLTAEPPQVARRPAAEPGAGAIKRY